MKMIEFRLRIEQIGPDMIVATLLGNTPNGELYTIASQSGKTAKEALDKVTKYLELTLHAGGIDHLLDERRVT